MGCPRAKVVEFLANRYPGPLWTAGASVAAAAQMPDPAPARSANPLQLPGSTLCLQRQLKVNKSTLTRPLANAATLDCHLRCCSFVARDCGSGSSDLDCTDSELCEYLTSSTMLGWMLRRGEDAPDAPGDGGRIMMLDCFELSRKDEAKLLKQTPPRSTSQTLLHPSLPQEPSKAPSLGHPRGTMSSPRRDQQQTR